MTTERARINVILRGEQSGRQVAVDDTVAAGSKGPPLHHHDFDETFYVLEGEQVSSPSSWKTRSSRGSGESWPSLPAASPTPSPTSAASRRGY